MTADQSEFGRRSILRNGALASGALLFGTSVAAAARGGSRKRAGASNPAKSGGVAYVPAKPKALKNARFKIGKRLKQRLKHNASCAGHGKQKEYVAYSLLPPKKGKTAPAAVMYVNPKRNIATGGTQVYEFQNADLCSAGKQATKTVTVSQANFKPVE